MFGRMFIHLLDSQTWLHECEHCCLLHTSGTNDADLVNLCEESYFNTWSSSALTSTCASFAATMCMTAPATPTHAGACNISIAFYSMSLRSLILDSRIADSLPQDHWPTVSCWLDRTQHPQEGSVQPGQCPGVCGPVQPPSPVCLGR